jgi:8-oxo-dGTP pyrophosphatase MutT (NUDIX family)
MSHIHQTPGHVDHTVEVFIVYKDKVLLRKHEKYGIWLSVGGHIELDEDPNQSALREVKEEVGLDITLLTPKDFRVFKEDGYQELIPPVFTNRHRINTDHEHVTYTYFASSTHDVVKPESENDVWQWFSKDEIETSLDLRPRVKHYALTALAAVAG